METGLKMTDQKFCAWCAGQLVWNDIFATCQNCNRNLFLNPRPCTAIFVQFENDILLLRRSIEPQKGLLDLPGGFVDIDDESLEDGAVRELKEEIGINIDRDRLQYIDSNGYHAYEYQGVLLPNLIAYFSVSITKEQSRKLVLDGENSEFVWIDLADIESHKIAFDCYWPMINKLKNTLSKRS